MAERLRGPADSVVIPRWRIWTSTVLEAIQIASGAPSKMQLRDLSKACAAAIARLKSEVSEARLPLFIEFAGTPKSGKSSIINVIAHFLRSKKLRVASPPEGASLRTPQPLTFNAWSGCYALQNILVDCFAEPSFDVVLLDRGLFDIAGWMHFLSKHENRITDADRKVVCDFFGLDLWRARTNVVFLFTADHRTALARENEAMLTEKSGSVMNADTLQALNSAYKQAAGQFRESFRYIYHVDTSFRGSVRPSFRMIAYQVAERIVAIAEELGTQELLVIPVPSFAGFQTEARAVHRFIETIFRDGEPRFEERSAAEASKSVVQIVPYAMVVDKRGRYLRLRRKANGQRKELQRKLTILVGGHAEKKDFDPKDYPKTFENCLRRELDEEFVSLRVETIKRLGVVYDPDTPVGAHHVAIIHQVTVGGKPGVRKQALDNEFGREPIEWVTAEDIGEFAQELDPWSQLVAHKMFDVPLPPSGGLFRGLP